MAPLNTLDTHFGAEPEKVPVEAHRSRQQDTTATETQDYHSPTDADSDRIAPASVTRPAPIIIEDNSASGDELEPILSRTATKRKHSTVVIEDVNDSEDDEDNMNTSASKAPPGIEKRKPEKKLKSNPATEDCVDKDGILEAIAVQPIDEPPLQPEDRGQDINNFFDKPALRVGKGGTQKMHRRCRLCSGGTKYLVSDVTTCRRHMESKHREAYIKWTLETEFESKLPADVKRRKKAEERLRQEEEKFRQEELTHLRKRAEKERVIEYSHIAFRHAAIEWLIATDQPLSALEHPKFKELIELAARAPGDIRIPDRLVATKYTGKHEHEQT